MAVKTPGRPAAARAVRYAVAGLGYIAQEAVLPAFAHARKNSALAALISDDPAKLRTLGKRYGVSQLCGHDGMEACLAGGGVDALFIATPNSEHLPLAVRAAEAGVHVLCEKPLAVTARECRIMIDACRRAGVKLMTAYRLHFEAANLRALKAVRSGSIGDPRIFNAVFTMQVNDPDNIRLNAALGGGPLHDIGIYCINAARTFFASEPLSVFAWATRGQDPRFSEVEESIAAVLRFPADRLATLVCSFGAADAGHCQVVGTTGDVRLDPAFEFHEGLTLAITVQGRTSRRRYARRDQFAPELLYFSDCILHHRDPEPSGAEGLADVRAIRAIHQSLRTGGPVYLTPGEPVRHPSPAQRIDRPPPRKPRTIHARRPSGD